jgi:hypothetical protein
MRSRAGEYERTRALEQLAQKEESLDAAVLHA